jgi:putative ABC transport system substrate-binding protein
MRAYILMGVAALGSLLSMAPAEAERKPGIARVGILAMGACTDQDPAIIKELVALGYAEGKNIEFDCILARGQLDRLPQFADELVHRDVDVILVGGTPGILAAQHATQTIPIVMWVSGDAVREGLVASLAHPGGNTTGNTEITIELLGKRLELLREIVPNVKRLAVLSGRGAPRTFIAPFMKDMEELGRANGISVNLVEHAGDLNTLADAFTAMARDPPDALYVIESPFAYANAKAIGDLALAHRIPTITGGVIVARGGLLLGYGVNEDDATRRVAYYVDKILRGAKPADLPVQQSTKFDLIVNARTARALGLTIPQSILLRADEVIE